MREPMPASYRKEWHDENTNMRSRSPLAHAALLACLTLGAAVALPAQQAYAQGSISQTYQIGPGTLDQALNRFATQAGITLSINGELTAGLSSAGLNGQFSVPDALAQLLQGTELQAVRNANGTYSLRRIEAQTLPEVTVSASRTGVTGNALPEVVVTAGAWNGTTEGTGSYTQTGPSSTATKLGLTLRETPQSVTVVTSQRIEDQGLTSLNDVVQVTPGLTVTKWGGERYRFTSRGFQVDNLMVDGIPIQYEEAALSTGTMSMYDRVEVMRGAAGLMEGTGTPGGSINLMRKRPSKEFQGSFTGSVGSWDNYLGSFDVGGPINDAGTLRGRTVISYQDKESFIDDYANKRTLVYGILEADLMPATTATLGFSYSNEDNPGADWNGIGTWPDGSFLPISRSTRMSPSWSYWDKKSITVFADVEHRFDNGWKAKLAAMSIDSEMDMMGTYLANPTAAPSYDLVGGSPAYRYARDQYSIDAYASGPVSLWGRTHEMAFGVSHRKNKWGDEGAPTDFTSVSFNPLDWNPRSVPKPTITGSWDLWTRDAEREQTGIYGSGRFKLSDPLTLIAGARLDWYKQTIAQQWAGSAYGASDFKVNHEFTPYLGAVYDVNPQHSIYASWTRIFNPQSYYTASGGLLDPQTGSNYEVGIKGEYFGGRLNASAAIFQIDLENLPDALPASQCTTGLVSCYRSAGEVRSRGVEFELNGELAPGWQMATSYTYTSAKRLSEASAYDPIGSYSIGKRYATNIPHHLFKLATTYRLQGELSRWKVGGSLHVQDGVKSPWSVKQGGYAIVGMHAGYAVTRQLDLSLNVNNLFDRKYYSTIGSYSDANFFGDPRNILLTAKYRF